MNPDDQTLVLQCQAGDTGAFQILVERYQRRVYGIAFGMVGNAEDAMDVTQDAFIKIHRNLAGFRGSSSFYTWIYRIVVNLCIDHFRKSGRVKNVDYDDQVGREDAGEVAAIVPSTKDFDPGRALDRRELRELLDKGLEELSDNHRAVILMREVEGLSYGEIAEVLGCSTGTVMSRLFYARKRMAVVLKELMAKGEEA